MTLDSLINRSDEILDLFKCLDDRDNSFDIETLLNDNREKFRAEYSLLNNDAGNGSIQQRLINKKRLIEYLNIFNSFEQYISNFYNIDASMKYNESTLLEALVQSGAKGQFKDATDLEDYMDLAIAYWKYQQSVYKRRVGE